MIDITTFSIPALDKKQQVALIEAGEQIALRFCCPVYLVGSAVTSEYPNDIDIIIATSEDTYLRLFANFEKLTASKTDHIYNAQAMMVQQAKIYKKQKEYFSKKVKGWDFDVKFQCIEQFIRHEGAKLRLDQIYENIW